MTPTRSAHVTAHRASETLDDSFVFPGTFAVQSHRGSVNVSLKSNTPIAAAAAAGAVCVCASERRRKRERVVNSVDVTLTVIFCARKDEEGEKS